MPFLKRFSLTMVLAALSMVAALIVRPADQPASSDLAPRIDALLTSVYTPAEPGAAVLVKKQGKVILRKGYGLANLELGVPVGPEMIFRLGSVTKQFTAVSILMLVEKGKLSLQDEITRFLPGYPTQGKTITVEHLLTHTSGIKSYTDMPEWLPLQRKDLTLAELIDMFKSQPMDFSPGERWKYNNSAYVLLGAIIEKASGLDYADFLKENIFGPLGMKASSYDSTARVIPRRVPGYAQGNSGYENAPYLSMTQPHAAGALLSSVDDLAIWNDAILGGKLVKRETLERAFTPYKLNDGSSTGYGFGWFITDYERHRMIEHGGGIHGFLSYALMVPEDQIFVAVLTNSTSERGRPEPLAFRIACLALGKPYPEPVPVALPEKSLDSFVGVYANAQNEEYYLIREGKKMFARRAGGRRSEVFALSPTEFAFGDSFARLHFVADKRGRVTGVKIVERLGPVQIFKRTEKPLPSERQAVALDPALYDQFVGEYELAPGFMIVITKENDKLMGQATGQPKVELFPESETRFFLKVEDAQIEFQKDESGRVVSLTLSQGGQKLPGRKIK